jgi:hypothetical protein
MRTREKLTLEEKFALALELIKREHSLDEIRLHYRVSHTTAYKIRNAFLEGGRAALNGDRKQRHELDIEERLRVLEALVIDGLGSLDRKVVRRMKAPGIDGRNADLMQARRASK